MSPHVVLIGVLTKKPDKRVAVKLSQENTESLSRFKEQVLAKMGVTMSLPSIANAAIKKGLPELEKQP